MHLSREGVGCKMAITQRADGKFDVRVTVVVHGTLLERRKRGLLSKGEAKFSENELKQGLLLLKQKGWDKTIKWSNAIDDYYQWKQKKIAYSTYTSMKTILNMHTKVWVDRHIDSFHAAEIEAHIEAVYTEEALESKRKLLRFIRDVFNRQIQLGKLNINPCAGLTFGNAPEKELIAMSRPEMDLLLRKAQELNHPWFVIWRVVYELGLRSGEGLGLKWTDVDFNNNQVVICRSYCSKSKKFGPTKNRKTRTIPLNQSLSAFLKELKLTCTESEFVLPQITEWKRGDAAEILRTFQSDLGIRQTNFHSLRASFITHLLLQKVPVTTVQLMVGHSDLKTTQRYVRLVASDFDGVTDALSMDLSMNKIADVVPIFKEL